MNKILSVLTAVLIGALAGCTAATDPATSSDNVTSTVLQISGAATSGANLEASVALSVPTTLPAGVTVGAPTLTYAVDTTYLGAANGTSGWYMNDGTWVANFTTVPSAGNTWVEETAAAAIGSTTAVAVKNWLNAGKLYLKSVVVPFSDGSSQTITFQTGDHWVHSVYTPATGSPVTEDVDLAWSYYATGASSDTNSGEVVAVSF